jgi:hypothetical protein
MILRCLSLLLLLPGLVPATISDWDWNGKGKGGKMPPIPVPPALHRPVLGAWVLGSGEERAGLHVDTQGTKDNGRVWDNPYAENNHFWGGGFSHRVGLAPGLEFMTALDYPFFVPSMTARFQPLRLDTALAPALTFEFGANAMPDLYAGGSFGLRMGPVFEAWGAYRGGRVLDRGYSELGTGFTFHGEQVMDIGVGLSWRRYDTEPFEQTGRASLRFDFGDPAARTVKKTVNKEEKRSAKPAPAALLEEEAVQGSAEPVRTDRSERSAQDLLEAGRFSAAREAYEKELLEHPDDAVRWKGYATALDELGLSRKAQNARERAKKLESR